MSVRIKKPTGSFWIHAIATLIWLTLMLGCDAYFLPFLLVGIAGLCCCHWQQTSIVVPFRQKLWMTVASCLFAAAVTLANYEVCAPVFLYPVCFVTGFITVRPILFYLLFLSEKAPSPQSYPYTPRRIWAISFCAMSGINLFTFLTSYLPGILTPDSIWQITQIQSGIYHNHHPFYHTQIIRLFYELGMLIFGNPNGAVACYCFFQILAMAAIFAYVIMTLYQMRLPLVWIGVCLAFYALMPFHIMYSFTVWKDILWGGMVVLFLTSIFRIFNNLGRSFCNGILLVLSSLGFCLLRSNGLFAFVLAAIFFILFFIKKYPKIAVLFVGIICVSWVMKGPVLEKLNVEQPDTIESLSIPAQQIARVIWAGETLTEEQYDLLRPLINIEEIPAQYQEGLSDPIKDMVRAGGNQDLISENPVTYLKLWVDIGLDHPGEYLKAWIRQTRGYWNSGYDYWIWADNVHTNTNGVSQNTLFPTVRYRLGNLFNFIKGPFVCIFTSIGFHAWLIAAVFFVSIARKHWASAFLMMPLLAIVVSLMVATPVFCEFRYAYGLFTSMPMVYLSFFYHSDGNAAQS